jgi:hypothetical protein
MSRWGMALDALVIVVLQQQKRHLAIRCGPVDCVGQVLVPDHLEDVSQRHTGKHGHRYGFHAGAGN